MVFAMASISTELGAKYIRHLCRHFNHKVEAVFNECEGRVQFQQGFCLMQQSSDTLCFYCQTENSENMRIIQYILDDHLRRFARTETLDYQWQNGIPENMQPMMAMVEASQL